jgi:hypothetical protein
MREQVGEGLAAGPILADGEDAAEGGESGEIDGF